jgi:hypothetical protein
MALINKFEERFKKLKQVEDDKDELIKVKDVSACCNMPLT